MGSIIKNSTELEKIWTKYKKTNDPKLKDELIVGYAPLVKYIAGRMNVHLCNNVEFDDLVSYGVLGLIDAVNKFQLAKNVKFETYASLRIRGSMYDNIRKLDWVPRNLRQKQKELTNTINQLEVQLGRSATNEEIADRLNVNVDDVDKMISDTNISAIMSLDEYSEQNYESGISNFKERQINQPEKEAEKSEVRQMLKNQLDNLTDRERKVIFLYYFDELTLKEISKVLEVSESRISQIHSKTLLKLRGKLGKYQNILLNV